MKIYIYIKIVTVRFQIAELFPSKQEKINCQDPGLYVYLVVTQYNEKELPTNKKKIEKNISKSLKLLTFIFLQ